MVYNFTISVECVSKVNIKAHDEESARKLVWDMIDSGDISPMDDDDGGWEVICQEEENDEDFPEDEIDATVDEYEYEEDEDDL